MEEVAELKTPEVNKSPETVETYTDVREGQIKTGKETNDAGFHRSFTPRQIHVSSLI